MKAKIGILSAVVVALALCLVPVAVAQTSVSVSFDGTYSAVSCIGPEGCVGAGLYGGTINGVNVGAGQSVPGMICDDYFDNITAGQTWNANGVNAASLTASNIGSLTLFGASIGVAGYTEVAYLANLMLTSSGLTSDPARCNFGSHLVYHLGRQERCIGFDRAGLLKRCARGLQSRHDFAEPVCESVRLLAKSARQGPAARNVEHGVGARGWSDFGLSCLGRSLLLRCDLLAISAPSWRHEICLIEIGLLPELKNKGVPNLARLCSLSASLDLGWPYPGPIPHLQFS